MNETSQTLLDELNSSARPNEVWRGNQNPGMLLDFKQF